METKHSPSEKWPHSRSPRGRRSSLQMASARARLEFPLKIFRSLHVRSSLHPSRFVKFYSAFFHVACPAASWQSLLSGLIIANGRRDCIHFREIFRKKSERILQDFLQNWTGGGPPPPPAEQEIPENGCQMGPAMIQSLPSDDCGWHSARPGPCQTSNLPAAGRQRGQETGKAENPMDAGRAEPCPGAGVQLGGFPGKLPGENHQRRQKP